MTIKSISVLACVVLLGTASLAQKQQPPEGGTPKNFVLPQGSTLTLESGLAATLVGYGLVPKVTIQVGIRSGNIDEGSQDTWLADLTGEMLKEGTQSMSAAEIARQTAAMGGTVAVSTGADRTSIEISVLSEFGPAAVNLLADIVQHPAFPVSELARLKNDLQRQLSIQQSDPQTIANARFAGILYGEHPYGRVLSTPKIIDGFTIERVKAFYEKNYAAVRTHVYVAGRFEQKHMEEAIRKGFGSWKRGEPFAPNIPKPVSQRAIYIVDRPKAPQSTIYMGLPTIDPSNPDYRALQVMNSLLGGSFSSRITSNIRENKGYTYSPFSMVSSRYRNAYWVQIADVSTDVTGASLQEIFKEIDRLQAEPPSEKELKGIQNYMAGVFVLQNSSPQGIIGQLAFLDLHGLPETYLSNAVADIYASTPKKIQALARDYIRDQEMTVVILGDRAMIKNQVARFGKIL